MHTYSLMCNQKPESCFRAAACVQRCEALPVYKKVEAEVDCQRWGASLWKNTYEIRWKCCELKLLWCFIVECQYNGKILIRSRLIAKSFFTYKEFVMVFLVHEKCVRPSAGTHTEPMYTLIICRTRFPFTSFTRFVNSCEMACMHLPTTKVGTNMALVLPSVATYCHHVLLFRRAGRAGAKGRWFPQHSFVPCLQWFLNLNSK